MSEYDIELIKLDMNKSDKHEHSDIDKDKEYLILYENRFFAGTFQRVWFGWSFVGWYAPLQFDAPGTNSSQWEQIWEIKRKEEAQPESAIKRLREEG